MNRQSLTLEHVRSLAAALRAVLELGDRRLKDAETRIEDVACRFAAEQGSLSPPEIRRDVQASRLDKRPLSSVQAHVHASPHLEQAIDAGVFALCAPQGPNEAQPAALSTIASFTPDGTSRLRFAILRLLRTPADEQHAHSIQRALDELELDGDATREAITSRFRQLSKELHPNKTQDDPDAAREAARKRFIRIKDAFDLLPDSRGWCRSPTTPSPIEATHALDVGCFFCETATSLPHQGPETHGMKPRFIHRSLIDTAPAHHPQPTSSPQTTT